jgi:hypothetical protein
MYRRQEGRARQTLNPDFKTIADFRRDNCAAFQSVLKTHAGYSFAMTSSGQATLLKLSPDGGSGKRGGVDGSARMSDIISGKTPVMQAEEAPGFPVAGGVRTTKMGPWPVVASGFGSLIPFRRSKCS